MCIIRDDFVHLSYRLGRKCCIPPGLEGVPFVVFALSLAGSSGLKVSVSAKIEGGDVGFRHLGGTLKSASWNETFFVPQSYYREHALKAGVREEGTQKIAMHRERELVRAEAQQRRATLAFSIIAEAVIRDDEEAKEQLEELLYCGLTDKVPVIFEEFSGDGD